MARACSPTSWRAPRTKAAAGFSTLPTRRELRRSLAQAERSEHELGGEPPRPGGEKPDTVDDQAFAAAALERLRTAERPWVVVVDNCDSAPDTPLLADLVPKPRAQGQVVIITTTDRGWLDYPADGEHRVELAGLGVSDLRDLRLPTGLSGAVDGRPLIALALAALRDRGGVALPESAEQDGPALIWDLLPAARQRAEPAVVELARLLAWLPPEPMPEQALEKVAVWDMSPGDVLTDLGFVTRSAEGRPRPAGRSGRRSGAGPAHAPAFRSCGSGRRAWRDDPGAAAAALTRLLTTDEGRWLFIAAADDRALARLEDGDNPDQPGAVRRAFRHLSDHPRPTGAAPGLLWYGLGHIREPGGARSALPRGRSPRRMRR